jgi:hypothetical protein
MADKVSPGQSHAAVKGFFVPGDARFDLLDLPRFPLLLGIEILGVLFLKLYDIQIVKGIAGQKLAEGASSLRLFKDLLKRFTDMGKGHDIQKLAFEHIHADSTHHGCGTA